MEKHTSTTLLILGGGPTGLGAATRLKELNVDDWLVLEQENRAGGLSRSFYGQSGFVWDFAGHITFPHYEYAKDVMEGVGCDYDMLERTRNVSVYYSNSDSFVAYPAQENLHQMPDDYKEACLDDLRVAWEARDQIPAKRQMNFETFSRKTCGDTFTDVFLRPYNEKLWSVPMNQMSCVWTGERVAVPDYPSNKARFDRNETKKSWGPNATFKYARRGGNSHMWDNIAVQCRDRIMYDTRVEKIDFRNRIVTVFDKAENEYRTISYKILLNTLPLKTLVCSLLRPILDPVQIQASRLVAKLKHSSVAVVCLGIEGPLADRWKDLTWAYFAEDDVPYYRCVFQSNICPDVCPTPSTQHALLFECAGSSARPLPDREVIERQVLKAAYRHGILVKGTTRVVEVKTLWMEFGYPVPCIDRDEVLRELIPLLETECNIISRGRFGGWKYEVANQDHSLMQGVEAADYILSQLPDFNYISKEDLIFKDQMTYFHPDYVNNPVNYNKRGLSIVPKSVPAQTASTITGPEPVSML